MPWPKYLLITPRLEPVYLLMGKKLKKDADKRELSTTEGRLVRLCHNTCWILVVLLPVMFGFGGFAEVPSLWLLIVLFAMQEKPEILRPRNHKNSESVTRGCYWILGAAVSFRGSLSQALNDLGTQCITSSDVSHNQRSESN